MDEPTRALAEDLVEAMRPLDVRVRAMFGGYTFYVDDKVVGLVNDGRVFVKRSSAEALLDGLAELAPAYPGARESWRLAADALALPRGRRPVGDRGNCRGAPHGPAAQVAHRAKWSQPRGAVGMPATDTPASPARSVTDPMTTQPRGTSSTRG